MRPAVGPLSIRTRLTLWYSAILLGILVVISLLAYSVLRWSLIQDLDASLLTVAQVLRDTGVAEDGSREADAEAALRELLGPEFYEKFFQLLDPEGRPEARGSRRRNEALRLSPEARANAARGRRTFETIPPNGREAVRLLTMPVVREGRVVQIVQVGISLHRAQGALLRSTLRQVVQRIDRFAVVADLEMQHVARGATAPAGSRPRTWPSASLCAAPAMSSTGWPTP